ncbi:MAG: prepilin-type N-terminal cleavage/methylation domain-containing protein [Massilia sp.]|uniref:type II secretion system protein n=1 Tax=Massilia sp. TaxID=1882437 RepID=UPI002FC75275
MLLYGIVNFNKPSLPGSVVQPKRKAMFRSFKRTAAAGFTLIELLIVVIILAIISAIAIPQFSAATADAQNSALDANLASVRNAIEQYRAQHTGFIYPGVNASSGGTCPAGAAQGTGEAGSFQAFRDQMQFASNARGQTCSVAGGEFRFGPYLRQGVPNEPINNVATITVTNTGVPIVPTAAIGGWAYDIRSGQFVMNSNAVGPDGRAFSAH